MERPGGRVQDVEIRGRLLGPVPFGPVQRRLGFRQLACLEMAQRGAELQPWIPAPLHTGDLVEGSAHQLVGPGDDEPEREPVQQPDDQRLVARRGHVREGLDGVVARPPPGGRPRVQTGCAGRRGPLEVGPQVGP